MFLVKCKQTHIVELATTVYFPLKPTEVHSVQSLLSCLEDVEYWTTTNSL